MNRAKIIMALLERPSNANQVSELLKLDYKTVQHHLQVLLDNSMIITPKKDAYGAVYFLSPLLEENLDVFKEIWERIGKK